VYVRGSEALRTEKLREVWLSPPHPSTKTAEGAAWCRGTTVPGTPEQRASGGPEVQGAGKNTGEVGNMPSKAHILDRKKNEI